MSWAEQSARLVFAQGGEMQVLGDDLDTDLALPSPLIAPAAGRSGCVGSPP
jgi:hypothetical protein